MSYKPTVVFDFDGVIHLYDGNWQGPEVITGDMVPGINKAIADIREAGYKVVVVSARCHSSNGTQGAAAILDWLLDHGIVVDDVMADKPPAHAYIDDRAIRFDGDATGLLEQVRSFQPWTKRGSSGNPQPTERELLRKVLDELPYSTRHMLYALVPGLADWNLEDMERLEADAAEG